MENIILPRTYVKLPEDKKVVYLFGPIKGAPKWRDEAIRYLIKRDPEVLIVSPQKELAQDLTSLVIQGKSDYYPTKRQWQNHYIDKTVRGGIGRTGMFWFPNQIEETPNMIYSATAFIDFGATITSWRLRKGTRFCVGIEEGFPNSKIMESDLLAYSPGKKIRRTLEATCEDALSIT